MKTTCKYCGIVEKPHNCPNKPKRNNSNYRNRIDSKAYESRRYKKARSKCFEKYNGQCMWSLYVEGTLRKAEEAHHIVEILDDSALSYDIDNLIPLTAKAHDEVHKLYKINKEKVQEILKLMQKDYSNGIINFSSYSKEISQLIPPIY